MKNISVKWKNLRGYFLAFLIVALAFLAVGIATLGSVYGTGSAYELKAKRASDTETPSVTFRLNNLTETKKNGTTTTTSLRLVGVYVNVAQIYAEAGTPATLRIERSTSGNSYTTGLNATFENFCTRTVDENGDPLKNVATPDAQDEFFRFVSPFKFPEDGWRVSNYPYIRLSLYGTGNPNVLINEVVFWGEKLDSGYQGTGEFCVIPATIHDATHNATESNRHARMQAEALLDAQRAPASAQSSYYRYSKGEIYSLMTIAEMRMGNEYAADSNGNALDTYHIDNVYGALGNDILALGTLMFGMSPFGLRFFPMLAAFGVLVVLSRLVATLLKSEKAGFVFALLFALSCLTLGYGRLGTPLMLGVFFFSCALSLANRFYANGIKRVSFGAMFPLLAAGLFGAAAMCVNGAFLIPVLGVIGLFVAGMVRMYTAKQDALEKIVEEGEVASATRPEAGETPAQRAGRVIAEYKSKRVAAPVLFVAGLVVGMLFFALIGMIPAHFAYLKAYDNPAAPSMNVFVLAWKAFAGGFAGSNSYASLSAWNPLAVLFSGEGTMYAITLLSVNPVAILAALCGVAFAVYRLVVLLKTKEHDAAWRSELCRIAILCGGLVLSLLAAVSVATPHAFVLLVYLFGFMLAANFFGGKYTGQMGTVLGIFNIIGVVLLAVVFGLLFVFTFSIPLPATFLATLGL